MIPYYDIEYKVINYKALVYIDKQMKFGLLVTKSNKY